MHPTNFLGPILASSAIVSSSFIGVVVASPMQAVRRYDPTVAELQNKAATAQDATLMASLVTASTAAVRLNLLQPEDFAYDFNNPPDGATTTGMGGHTVKADRKTFPALTGTGVGMTIGFLGPCGFNTPHTHPRSAEFNVVVKGALNSQFIAENGVDAISHNATEFQAVIFPQGAVHTEFNPTCNQSIFVAGFASEDPGVQQSAATFFWSSGSDSQGSDGRGWDVSGAGY